MFFWGKKLELWKWGSFNLAKITWTAAFKQEWKKNLINLQHNTYIVFPPGHKNHNVKKCQYLHIPQSFDAVQQFKKICAKTCILGESVQKCSYGILIKNILQDEMGWNKHDFTAKKRNQMKSEATRLSIPIQPMYKETLFLGL